MFRLRLLSCGDDGDWDGEKLCKGSGNGTQAQFDGCAWWFGNRLSSEVQRPNNRVPVEVCKVCGCDADKTPCHAGIETTDTLLFHNTGYCVQCAVVVLVVMTCMDVVDGLR